MPPYPTPAVPADFRAMQHHGTHLLVRRGCEQWVDRLVSTGDGLSTTAVPQNPPGADAFASERQDDGQEWVHGGRAAHPLICLPNGERVVVRAFRRGGVLRHLNSRFYVRGNRAFDELRATERARAGGVRTATVVAAAVRRTGPVYTAWLATRWIPDARDALASLLAVDAGETVRILREAGRQIGLMHAAGVAHPDLNLRNLLVGPAANGETPAVYLLDFDRARLYRVAVPVGRRARDLRRLARSAHKLQAPIHAAGWRALRDGYGADWPLDEPLG